MFNHAELLLKALEQAEINRGFCAPNPAVGAVIVNVGRVIAVGSHTGPGNPHAEIEALRTLEAIPSTAIMYVTLEPCCHYGRTPPCTEAIIQSGIKTVYYGFKDPNPIVAGKGEKQLQDAGINCQHFPMEAINAFYQSYTYWQQTKLPFVTAKIAMTFNGKTAAKNGPLKITGSVANEYTHQQRKRHDAILTTAKTINLDDPQLNVRLGKKPISKALYILDRHLSISATAKIFSAAKSITIFHALTANENNKLPDVRYLSIPEDAAGLDLKTILEMIGQDGVQDLWIEAGATCFNSFLKNNLIHRGLIYLAPTIQPEGIGLENFFTFQHLQPKYQQLGSDLLCTVNLR